jgi:hypothetical protein
MKKTGVFFVFIFLICLALIASPVSAIPPPDGTNYVTFYSNVDGATVYLDGIDMGVISQGYLDVPGGALRNDYLITKNGYYDATGPITQIAGPSSNLVITVTLTQKPIGSGVGFFRVHSAVEGASVAFDGSTKGTISGGIFILEVPVMGTPYTYFTVSKTGYSTDSEPITRMPSAGEYIDLYAILSPTPTVVMTTLGGDVGYYVIHSNVDGASVYLDSTYKGTTQNGVLSVPVYSTGTPYSTYRVEKNGYTSVMEKLPTSPAKGQTVQIYVTLSPSYSPTTEPTAAPVNPPGSGQGYIAIHANVDGAKVTIGSSTAGTIRNGVLTVTISTTGTPFSSFTVSKDGYTTVTGKVPRQPASGETVDVYVTLNAVPPTTLPPTKSPLPVFVPVIAITGALLVMAALGRNRKNS